MADLVMQVVRRCTFGFTPSLYQEVETLSPDVWLNRQLEPHHLRDDELDARLALLFPSVSLLSPEQRDDMEGSSHFAMEWRHSLLMRAVESRRQLQEVMVHVWYDHFNTSVREMHVAKSKVDEDKFLRTNSLGRFSELLKGMASMPTMLYYLDGVSNKVPEPNENFARELLELHTLGRGNFNEQDVHDAARVFTGWSVRRNQFHFEPRRHDSGPATVAGWTTPGRTGDAGVLDGMRLLDYLSRHPATARRVSERLVRRFVADDPPADLVDAAALAYRRNTTHIVPVLRMIFRHEAFRNAAAPKFQRPYELLAAALRVTNANVDWSPSSTSAVELSKRLNDLNHLPGEEASPAGFPDRADLWMGANDLLRRWELMADLGGGNMRGAKVDIQKLMGSDRPNNTAELVDRLSRRLLGRKLATDHRQALFTFLGRGPNAAVDDGLLRTRLGPLVGLLLATPDFSYR